MKTTMKQGAIHLTGASLLFIVVGYLINIVLGRLLGPVNYGIYGVLVSLISVANILQTSGLSQTMAKYISENEPIAREIFRSAISLQTIISVSLMCIFIVFAPYIALVLRDKSLEQYIRLAAFSFPLYGFYALYVDYYNGKHFFKKQALMTSIYSLSKAASVLFFGFLFSLKGVLIGYIIAPIFALSIGFFFPHKGKSHFPYKRLIFFSLPVIGYIIFSTLLQSIDLYFVKALLPPESAGYYTASQNISRILYFSTLAISSVILPSISQNVHLNLVSKVQETIQQALRIILFVIAGGAALIAATSRELLTFIYSDVYRAADESLAILVISFSFFTLFTLFATILTASGKPTISFVLSVVGLLINMILCSLLIPLFALNGAALASLISNGIVMIFSACIVYEKFTILLSPYKTMTIISGGCLTYLTSKVLVENHLFLPVVYLIAFGIYFGFLFLTKEIQKEDFDQLWQR